MSVVLDKTGTLTVGKPVVTQARRAPGVGEEDFLGAALSVEAMSEHPAARAIAGVRTGAGRSGPGDAAHFAAHPGLGASAVVAGRRVLVGSPRFLESAGVERRSAWA